MKIYQVLLLTGVIISSVMTSFYLVKMFGLLWRNSKESVISDEKLNGTLKELIISIVMLSLCSLVYCFTSIMD